mmetsp:Transcript_17389/g.36747  ORF Transcript_17389/g.36747 Transcript_17389/m.36747 type:complete len:262 (-) Transcript_17389:1806-2591(-)
MSPTVRSVSTSSSSLLPSALNHSTAEPSSPGVTGTPCTAIAALHTAATPICCTTNTARVADAKPPSAAIAVVSRLAQGRSPTRSVGRLPSPLSSAASSSSVVPQSLLQVISPSSPRSTSIGSPPSEAATARVHTSAHPPCAAATESTSAEQRVTPHRVTSTSLGKPEEPGTDSEPNETCRRKDACPPGGSTDKFTLLLLQQVPPLGRSAAAQPSGTATPPQKSRPRASPHTVAARSASVEHGQPTVVRRTEGLPPLQLLPG